MEPKRACHISQELQLVSGDCKSSRVLGIELWSHEETSALNFWTISASFVFLYKVNNLQSNPWSLVIETRKLRVLASDSWFKSPTVTVWVNESSLLPTMNLQSMVTCAPGITSITCSNQFNRKKKVQNPVEEKEIGCMEKAASSGRLGIACSDYGYTMTYKCLMFLGPWIFC